MPHKLYPPIHTTTFITNKALLTPVPCGIATVINQKKVVPACYWPKQVPRAWANTVEIITSFCHLEVIQQLASGNWEIRDFNTGSVSEINEQLLNELINEHTLLSNYSINQ